MPPACLRSLIFLFFSSETPPVSVRFLFDLNSSLFKMIKRGRRRFQVNRKNGGKMITKFEFHTNVAFFCSRVN